MRTTPRKMTLQGKHTAGSLATCRRHQEDLLLSVSDHLHASHAILSIYCCLLVVLIVLIAIHDCSSFSNNKATLDSSRKFLLGCKDKLKPTEENRSSGIHEIHVCVYFPHIFPTANLFLSFIFRYVSTSLRFLYCVFAQNKSIK